MPKVTETCIWTQDHLREKATHLNLANYLYNLEAIAKETGKPKDLKITYVLDKNALQPRYELHRLHTIECILWVRRICIQLPPASPTVINLPSCMYECFEFTFVPCR